MRSASFCVVSAAVVAGGARSALLSVTVPLMVPFGVAVAEKVTGEPESPVADAWTLSVPAKRPSVYVTDATPLALVGVLGALRVPEPEVTVQATVALGTPFP
jgi:hypothetical protein